MPTYQITAPDGTKYKITGQGSEQEALAALKKQLGASEQLAPKQRLRSIAQGVTLGLGDEFEAGIRAPFSDRSYSEIRDEVRGGLKDYQRDYPKSSMAYEIGGAVLPGVLAAPFTGGGSTAATAGRLAAMGALEGGAYAYGTGEEGAVEDLKRIPMGAAVGGVAAPIAGYAMKGAGKLAKNAVNAAKRKFGSKAARAVEAEIQRLAREAKMSTDEIVDGIRNGRIMAENQTLLDAVRGIQTEGGEAGAKLTSGMINRANKTRKQAARAIGNQLADDADDNIVKTMRRSDDAVRAAERQAYEPFKTIEASREVMDELAGAIKSVPRATKEIKEALKARGSSPLYSISKETGEVVFNRTPTVEEAEVVRRAINNAASGRFKKGLGMAGESIASVEKGLRGSLDDTVPDLAATRANASKIRSARDAYKFAETALSKSADDVELAWEEAVQAGEGAVKAFRAGVQRDIRKRLGRPSKASLMRNLADPESSMRRTLELVLPEEQFDDVMRQVENAAQSQNAKNVIIGGSDTARSLKQGAAREGIDINPYELAEVGRGSPFALVSIAQKVAKKFRPQLTDAQRAQVVDVLVSENPDFVRRALADAGGMDSLTAAIDNITARLARGAGRGAAVGGAVGGDVTSPRRPLTIDVNKPLPQTR